MIFNYLSRQLCNEWNNCVQRLCVAHRLACRGRHGSLSAKHRLQKRVSLGHTSFGKQNIETLFGIFSFSKLIVTLQSRFEKWCSFAGGHWTLFRSLFCFICSFDDLPVSFPVGWINGVFGRLTMAYKGNAFKTDKTRNGREMKLIVRRICIVWVCPFNTHTHTLGLDLKIGCLPFPFTSDAEKFDSKCSKQMDCRLVVASDLVSNFFVGSSGFVLQKQLSLSCPV